MCNTIMVKEVLKFLTSENSSIVCAVTMPSEATPMSVTVLMLVGVDLIDIQYRFSLLLPGLHPCLATTHNFVPNSSFLQFLDVSLAVPGLLCLFLVVEQSLLHPK